MEEHRLFYKGDDNEGDPILTSRDFPDGIPFKKLIEIIENRGEIILNGTFYGKMIVCDLKLDDPWSKVIPVVVSSNHERFIKGYRFHYGFLSICLREGYSVMYTGRLS